MSRHAAPARRRRPPDSIAVGDLILRYGAGGASCANHARPPRRSGLALPSLTARPVLAATVILSTATALEVPHLITDAGRASQPHGVSSPAALGGTLFPVRVPASVPREAHDALGEGHPAQQSARPATAPTTPISTPRVLAARVSRGTKRTQLRPVRTSGQIVAGGWVRPNSGAQTSCFCRRWGTMHWGIDLAGPLGSPILAVGDGTVLQAGPAEGFGNWVVIQHAGGDVSIYGHMRYYFVHAGEAVQAGQRIALVGSEGNSTGPHLHFEIHRGGLDGAKIDPVPWLAARGIRVGPNDPTG